MLIICIIYFSANRVREGLILQGKKKRRKGKKEKKKKIGGLIATLAVPEKYMSAIKLES